MKRLFAIVISFVLFVGASNVIAQSNAKLGYINSSELMQLIPGKDTVDTQIADYEATLQQTLEALITEYQSKGQEYQNNAATMSQIIRQTKEREIADLEGRIQEFQQGAEQDFQQKRAELYNPLLTRAKDAIEAVAKEHGYTYIFDTSMGTILYFETGDNIMALVKSKLGI